MPRDGRSESFQDMDSTPILVGADVKTLYPSLSIQGTAELASEAVKNTNIKFTGFDYQFIAIYLFLILGTVGMRKLGLSKYIPVI